jgi:putative flippase GtrA
MVVGFMKKLSGEIVLYTVFGVLTTLVNFLVYIVSAHIFDVQIIIATGIAWIASVIFAYITNMRHVFRFKPRSRSQLVMSFLEFVSTRAFSAFIDMGLMWIMAYALSLNDIISKISANAVVVVLNYVLSKFFVFRKKDEAND